MSTVLRLLFLIPIGFILACCAGAVALLWPFVDLSPAALADPAEVLDLMILFTAQAAQVGVTALVPFLIFLVLSEALRLRSILIYLVLGLVGGALAAHAGAVSPDMRVQTATIVAGLAFALTYWIVAGHRAGRARPAPPRASPHPAPPPAPIPAPPQAKD